ncbi:hypothetical protein GOP47_0015733 [Adiantum capillus-veneris]|uniref:NADP-dependent oxidoreductase domain-containing protein n=1 Tax=Adiantum capillus-veneris TaxID=13818 RepID=A0A9D4UL07_ADICA|nr:hypothetical protein GOP47_0015733 [Adiantum capillus-veneris]
MGLGTWAWGNKFLWGYDESMDMELQEVFNLAVNTGINLFDTADSYGTGRLNGRSELLLGNFIRDYSGSEQRRRNIHIATKFAAYPWRLTSRQLVTACKASLRRLNCERLAIGQLHWSTANYAPFQEQALWSGLVAMYEEGLVQAVGVSNYGPRQLEKVHDYLERKGVPLSTAQVQFSLVSNGPEQLDIKALCQSLGIKLIAYSPLGLGMLTGKYSQASLPKGPRGALFQRILPGLEPLLKVLTSISKQRGKTMSQVALNWCICKGTIPIPGVKNLRQAQDNLGALGWKLTNAEVSQLDEASNQISMGMIQNIFQTK